MMTSRYAATPRIFPMLILLFFFFTTIAFSQQSPGRSANTAGDRPGRFVTIDFNNVDIVVFIKFISELTSKNFIIDQLYASE